MSDIPSMDEWLREAKDEPDAGMCGIYLVHNGTVRQSSRAKVREGADDNRTVIGMNLSFDEDKVQEAICEASEMPGVYYVRAWLNEGCLNTGDDIMYVMIGADTRSNASSALDGLVGTLKNSCITEEEVF